MIIYHLATKIENDIHLLHDHILQLHPFEVASYVYVGSCIAKNAATCEQSLQLSNKCAMECVDKGKFF